MSVPKFEFVKDKRKVSYSGQTTIQNMTSAAGAIRAHAKSVVV
jgi:hypothetical protein